jgi:MoxR-like ATPase
MATYIPSSELKNAVQVAFRMSLPLLLTGEPGCGKTECARWIQSDAYKADFVKLLRFDTKTTSVAKDLFYRYDAIRHFRDAQKRDVNVLDYISFTALGQAILATSVGKRTVVLIDEVDKAPRDFPNDLLFEIENLSFRIEEATLSDIQTYAGWANKAELKLLDIEKPVFDPDSGVFQCANKQLRPFVLLTSNSEKNLPDAFMRRCAYFHLTFPEGEKGAVILREIIQKQTWKLPPAQIQDTLIRFFNDVRKQGFRKNPGIAEMLNWLQCLNHLDKESAAEFKDALKNAALLLAKNKEDNNQLLNFIDGWQGV